MECLIYPAAMLVTGLASVAHGQHWATLNIVRALHAASLSLIPCLLAEAPWWQSCISGCLAATLFWLTMRRGEEAEDELDGLDQQEGRVYDANEINENYEVPVFAVALYSGVIYGILGDLYFIGASLLLCVSIRIPAIVIDRLNYKDRAKMLSPGGSRNRALSEVLIGIAPCGLCLGALIHSASVLGRW